MSQTVNDRVYAYFPALLKQAGRWSNTPEDRYDLAVDTLVYSMENSDKFRPDGGFYNWLIWNMRAVVARRKKSVVIVEFVDSYHSPRVSAGQESSVDLTTVLSGKYGEDLAMIGAGYTQSDIARTKGVSTQSVSQRIARARGHYE